MGFVKVDVGLLDSTLWANRDQRDTFLTALLMAKPYELEHPTPQLEVDSLACTGFEIPPGWYGFVPAAGQGILRKALVKPGPGMEALRSLGQPDPESRSKDFEGRRLVRIDGGYIVLNYIKYRDRDYTTADRSQRYRDRKKEKDHSVTASRRDGVTTRRDITQADAEADAEVHQPPSVSGAAAGAPVVVALPSAEGLWSPGQELLLRWKATWPGLDLLLELGRVLTFLQGHPKARYSHARLVPWVEAWLAKEAVGSRREPGALARAAPRTGAPPGGSSRAQVASMPSPKLERIPPGGAP